MAELTVPTHDDVLAELPDEAWLAALLSLDAMGPNRLAALRQRRTPRQAWEAVAAGSLNSDRAVGTSLGGKGAETLAAWRRTARSFDVAAGWARYAALGVGVAKLGAPSYPAAFVADPEPPALVFHQGDLGVLGGARVGIVGTRRCTRYGRDLAYELGAGLAEAGVAVVSGLARGIDAAAHRGLVDAGGAPPIAVVGSGHDVVYPTQNRGLWQTVTERGLLLSEAPLGAPPTRWRFPARNRLIAALSDVLIVVESHAKGGSLSTVFEALERDRPVLAVPGPVRSPASVGTNRLLVDGAQACCGVDDALAALGLTAGRRRPTLDPRLTPGPWAQEVLDILGWQPASLDRIVLTSGLEVTQAVAAVEELLAKGWVARTEGWIERVSAGATQQ